MQAAEGCLLPVSWDGREVRELSGIVFQKESTPFVKRPPSGTQSTPPLLSHHARFSVHNRKASGMFGIVNILTFTSLES